MIDAQQTSPVERARRAAEAHTNLTVFHGVMALLEGGTLYGPRPQSAARRIIDICKKAAKAELAIMDREMEALGNA